MDVVRPSCTMDVVVLNTCCIEGSVGRYISVTNGPKAVSMPRKMTRNMKYLVVMEAFG
jgi:hypothetical protein